MTRRDAEENFVLFRRWFLQADYFAVRQWWDLAELFNAYLGLGDDDDMLFYAWDAEVIALKEGKSLVPHFWKWGDFEDDPISAAYLACEWQKFCRWIASDGLVQWQAFCKMGLLEGEPELVPYDERVQAEYDKAVDHAVWDWMDDDLEYWEVDATQDRQRDGVVGK